MFHVKHALDVQRILTARGLLVTDTQREQLSAFVRQVIAWNAKINLISRKDEEQIWFSHILHSLSPLLYVDIPRGAHVLDLGTGGGFPGVPIAIVREDLHCTLLDSIRKKTMALQEIVARVQLHNVAVATGRAEEVGKQGVQAPLFDCVVARAVAPLRELVRWSRPLVRRSGDRDHGGGRAGVRRVRAPFLLAMKGGDLGAEIRMAEVKEGASDVEVIDIVFDGSEAIGLEEKKIVLVPL
jgi:16S rRNA (guanine527-N7)-methyltransferase